MMKTVLFECKHLYYLPQFEPIIHELRNRGNYHLFASIPLTTTSWEQYYFSKAISEFKISLLTAETEIERIDLLHKNSFDVIIVGNIGSVRQIATDKTLVVMVYHGIGLKKSYYHDISSRVNLRAVESKMRNQELRNAGANNLTLTGFTKLDSLFQVSTTNKNNILKETNLNPETKTVLYAPTFYPTSLKLMLPELNRLSEKVNVIVKLHNFSWHHKRYQFQSKFVEKNASDRVYLTQPHEYNILPYFSISDVLVTDMSSTMFEFLAVNRPIIQTSFYDVKLRHRLFPWRLKKKLDKIRQKEVDFVYKLQNPENCVEFVNRVLQNSDEMSEIRKKAAERYLFQLDGKASIRLVDAIEEKFTLNPEF